MVSLPQIPRRIALSETPESSLTRADIAAPYAHISDVLDKAGGALNEVAVRSAHEAGLQSVTTDENGKLKVVDVPLMVGPAADAYQRAAMQTYVAKIDPEIRKATAEARVKFEGDPKGFQSWADGYINNLGTDLPWKELKNSVGAIALRHTTETYSGILARQQARSIEESRGAMQAQQATLENELLGLARGGDKDSEAFNSRLTDWVSIQKDRAGNPLFGYSSAQADYDRTQFLSRLEAAGHLHTVEKIARDQSVAADGTANGGVEKALTAAERLLTDPKLNLTEAQRYAYYHKATAEIRAMEAERRRDLGEAKRSAVQVQTLASTGVEISPELETNVTNALRAAGGTAEAASFSAAMVRARQLESFNKLPLAEQVSRINEMSATPKPDGTTEQGRVVAGTEADPQLLGGMQRGVKAKARDAWSAIEKDLDAGIRPADAVMNGVVDAARIAGDHDLLLRIGARVERFDAVRKLGQQPVATQDAARAELERAGAVGDLAPGNAALLADLKARTAALTEGLRTNPVATTVTNFGGRFATPAPLDVSASTTLRAGLADRAAIAQFGAQNWGLPALSALDRSDLAAVQTALSQADPAGKARIFADIDAALPPSVRAATLAKIGENGGMLEAFAGALPPPLAISVFRGQGAIATDPHNSPEKQDGDAFRRALDQAMPASTFGIAARTNPTGAYATMRGAVIARYADLTATDPTGGKDFSEPRLRRAVTDVTGGVLLHNGGAIIAPARGMTQRDFDSILFGLADADLTGATTLDGKPVTAAYLRGRAKLESVADGRYFILLGGDPEQPLYAVSGIGVDLARPEPFVLDLRGRAPTPLRVQLGDVTAPGFQ